MAITSSSLVDRIRPAVRKRGTYLVKSFGEIEVKINQNESPYDLPEELKEELVGQAKEMAWNRYPTEFANHLRSRLSEHLNHPEEGILIGNGSNELIYTIGLALIAPDTPVVLPKPMFSLYQKVVKLYDGELITVAPQENLRFDTPALIEAIQEHQPAVVIITTPNNPTGLALSAEEVQQIVEAADDGFVVVDEAYYDFVEGESAKQLIADHPNVLVLRTFSKAWGLAGLRIGYLMGDPAVVGELYKARIPFMINPFTEQVACAALDRLDLLEERVEKIIDERNQLFEALNALPGVDPLPSSANFLTFKTPVDPDQLIEMMAQEKILIRNVSSYPELEGYVRVNAGTPKENKAFLTTLKTALGR